MFRPAGFTCDPLPHPQSTQQSFTSRSRPFTCPSQTTHREVMLQRDRDREREMCLHLLFLLSNTNPLPLSFSLRFEYFFLHASKALHCQSISNISLYILTFRCIYKQQLKKFIYLFIHSCIHSSTYLTLIMHFLYLSHFLSLFLFPLSSN